MLISSAPLVEAQPQVTLTRWGIVNSPSGELYFVGHCVERGSSCFSTAVQLFDPTSRKGITLSGRVYHLAGVHGLDAEGLYLLEVIRACNEVAYTDVTAKMLTSIYSKMH